MLDDFALEPPPALLGGVALELPPTLVGGVDVRLFPEPLVVVVVVVELWEPAEEPWE